MIVDMWMTLDPQTIAPDATVADAAAAMSRARVRRLPVVRAGAGGPLLVGIVSERDIARAFPANVNPNAALVPQNVAPRPITDIMTRSVLTTTPETPIEDAAHLMRTRKVGALPVVRGERLVGIITESDVFRAFVETSGGGRPGLRVTFELADDEDVTATIVDLCREHHVALVSLLAFHHDDRRSGQRRRLAVARLEGAASEALLDAIWKSKHRVVAVLRTGPTHGAAVR